MYISSKSMPLLLVERNEKKQKGINYRSFPAIQYTFHSRNPSSKLNQEIEEEVGAFTARASSQPTDDEFLVLENTIRELRAKYVKNGGSRGGSAAGSRGGSDGGRRGSAASRGGGTRSNSKRAVSTDGIEGWSVYFRHTCRQKLIRRSGPPCLSVASFIGDSEWRSRFYMHGYMSYCTSLSGP